MLRSIEIVLRLLELWFVDWHKKQSQKERDRLEGNPAEWFSDHFGGVRNGTQPAPDKTDAKN